MRTRARKISKADERRTIVDAIIDLVEAYDKKDCSVEGCMAPRRYRQYCANHYAALKRAGKHPKDEPRIKVSPAMYTLIEACAYEGDDCLPWPHGISAGYPCLALKRKPIRAHVAVCEQVHGFKPSEKHEAAHECGNSRCVNPRHLSWKTHKENIADKRRHNTLPIGEKHHQAKLCEAEVIEIRSLRGLVRRRDMADRFGVGLSTISNIIDGVTWRHV